MDYTKRSLPTGLRTIVVPRPDVQSVTFLVLIGVGSRYETPKQSGLSHFLEHMFFKGTENRPTTRQIAEELDGIGGEFNAFTGEEYTGYYVKVAADHLEQGADVVSDILLRPLFQPEEIERERGVIAEEIRMYTDMPMRHVQHLWQRALFGDHPLGRRIDGSEETINAFTRANFARYTRNHYHTRNAVVAVAGNADSHGTHKRLRGLFESLAQGEETHPKPAPKKAPRKRFVHEYRKHLDQTHVIAGVPGVAYDDPRRPAARVLATVLGGGMSSRLFLRVREREGLAYMVRTSSEHYTDAGSLATQAGVRTDKAKDALGIILEEYDRVIEEPLSDEELAKAKEMIKGRLLLQLEETDELGMFAASQLLLEGRIRKPADIIRRVERVTAKDVQNVAAELLAPKKRAVALLSPHTSSAQFEKLLA